MKVDFIKKSKFLGNRYVIYISKFTPDSINEVLNTIAHTNVTVIRSDTLIAIFCDDEPTFNWIYLQLG